MTTFYTVMENDSDSKVPAIPVFESVNDGRAAAKFASRHNRLYPGRFTVTPHKMKD